MTVSHSETLSPGSTQDVILEVACELMSAHGFGGMSMRALAQQVGIQPGSLYSHFSCKQEILEVLAERLIARRTHVWSGSKSCSRHPARQLDAFVDAYIDLNTGCPQAHHILATELRHLAGASRERIKRHRTRYIDELSRLIYRGHQCGVFKVTQSTVTAKIILAMLDGLLNRGQGCLDLLDQTVVIEVKKIINKMVGGQC